MSNAHFIISLIYFSSDQQWIFIIRLCASCPLDDGNPFARKCNGLENLCDVPVDEAMWATLHNAYSTDEDFFAAANHYSQLQTAVENGWRGINLDIGKCGGELVFVHTKCFFGNSDPVKVFQWLDTWLDDNPNEVLLMPIQIDNDAGGTVTLQEIYDMLSQAGDFVNKLYVHERPATVFPTFNELIDRQQRVMFFVYNGESCASLGAACPRGFYDWFSIAAESRFSFNSVEEIQNDDYSCEATRGIIRPEGVFYGLNLFLSIPSDEAAKTLNTADFLRAHIEACSAKYGGWDVNLLLVDFWSIGDTLAVVEEYNRLL